MKKSFIVSIFISVCCAANADVAQVTPNLVMTGVSSAFNDGVWLSVPGQVASVNCYYAPTNVSLFYARPTGMIDSNKVLAILMAAKLTGSSVSIQYINNSTQSDFYGYGISMCEMQRLVLM